MKKMGISDLDMGITLNGVKHAVSKRILSPWKKYQRLLKHSQWWSLSALKDYQLEQLKRLVHHAYQHVPYYHGTMQVFNVQPEDIRTLDDLALMPFVEKDMVRQRSRDFLSTRALPFLYKCHTSGTTGTPLTLYRDFNNIGFEYAMLSRQRQWAGLKPGDLYATLKGELLPGRVINRGHYWSMNAAEHKLVMSSYHLSEATAHRYIEALSTYQPEAIDGYPSSIYALAKFMLERNIKIPMKAILTSSETLVPEQKSIIETAFNCYVYDYYGMAERVAAIHTCERGRYHIVPEYSILEFMRHPNLAENHFEIVGTALNNIAMPLIRYRMGDIVQLAEGTCECGRNYPMVDGIIGRMDDYVVTPSGKMVGRLDHIFKGVQNLIQAQIYQPETGVIILRVVPDKSFSKQDGDLILEKLYDRVGDGIRFEIENVPFIPRTSRGKIKSVVSEVVF